MKRMGACAQEYCSIQVDSSSGVRLMSHQSEQIACQLNPFPDVSTIDPH